VNGVSNPSFTYDANGNMTAGAGRTVAYTPFNMADTITQGSSVYSFTYDDAHARITQVAPNLTTTYLNAMDGMEEKAVAGTTTTWNDYIKADGALVAERICTGSAPCTGANAAWKYFLTDNLGSVAVVLKSQGYVDTRLSYDAWGMRRNSDGSPMTACGQITSPTTRGFTGQEEMDGLCLVNMNARIYDPQIGRFMAPDPTTEAPYDLQDLNRYSYVFNNPLRHTDPTGLCFLGCFWHSSLFRSVAAIAISFALPEFLPGLETALIGTAFSSTVNLGIAGGVAGYVTSGKLKGALIGGLQAVAFATVAGPLGKDIAGGLGGSPGAAFAGSFVARGLIGGVASAAGGGKFGSGFLAAGVGGIVNTGGSINVFGAIESATLGGVASVLGGGKFADGAVTAAFAYAASTLRELEDQGVSATGSHPMAPDLDKVLLSYLHREGDTLSGTVETQCNPGIDCETPIDELNTSYNHAYLNGYKLSIDFVQVTGRDVPELSIENDTFEACGNSADSYACAAAGSGHIYLTDSYKYQPNIIAHEFGHILGFGDSSNPASVMYYTIPHPAYLPAPDARRLIDEYPK